MQKHGLGREKLSETAWREQGYELDTGNADQFGVRLTLRSVLQNKALGTKATDGTTKRADQGNLVRPSSHPDQLTPASMSLLSLHLTVMRT